MAAYAGSEPVSARRASRSSPSSRKAGALGTLFRATGARTLRTHAGNPLRMSQTGLSLLRHGGQKGTVPFWSGVDAFALADRLLLLSLGRDLDHVPGQPNALEAADEQRRRIDLVPAQPVGGRARE